MPNAECQMPTEKMPFDVKEKRVLTIRAERIDPKHLTDGRPPEIEAEHKRTECRPTHKARHYALVVGRLNNPAIRVQLNHGNPADDETRLVEIAESILSVDPEGAGP